MLARLPTLDHVHDVDNAATVRRKWAAKFVIVLAMSLGVGVVLTIVTMQQRASNFAVVAAPSVVPVVLPVDATTPAGAPKSSIIQLDEVTVVGRLNAVR